MITHQYIIVIFQEICPPTSIFYHTNKLGSNITVTSLWACWRLKSPGSRLFTCLFRRRSRKTSKLRVTGLCAGNSSVTGEFPAQMASNAENGSIWWRHNEGGQNAMQIHASFYVFFYQLCIKNGGSLSWYNANHVSISPSKRNWYT